MTELRNWAGNIRFSANREAPRIPNRNMGPELR